MSRPHGNAAGQGVLACRSRIDPLTPKLTVVSKTEECAVVRKIIPNETLRVISTTDLHLRSDPEKCEKAFRFLTYHIRDIQPDLLILTGDLFLSRAPMDDALRFAARLEEAGVFWAFTFGNHDVQELTPFLQKKLVHRLSAFPHCLTCPGLPEIPGNGNCRIEALNADGSFCKALVLLDSHTDITPASALRAGLPADARGDDYIYPEQIGWFERGMRRIRAQYGGRAGSLVFFHTPLPEYKRLFRNSSDGLPVRTQEGRLLYGTAVENICAHAYNSGFFDAMKRCGGEALYVGHDHVNDFCAELEGVLLIYSQTGGYDTYTMADKTDLPERDWPNGVTVTDVLPDGSFTVYPRYTGRHYL